MVPSYDPENTLPEATASTLTASSCPSHFLHIQELVFSCLQHVPTSLPLPLRLLPLPETVTQGNHSSLHMMMMH